MNAKQHTLALFGTTSACSQFPTPHKGNECAVCIEVTLMAAMADARRAAVEDAIRRAEDEGRYIDNDLRRALLDDAGATTCDCARYNERGEHRAECGAKR